MSGKGLTHLYIGRGQGKTTAALGLMLRACSAKKKCCLVQFLKARGSSEAAALKKLKIDVVTFRERHPMFYSKTNIDMLKKQISRDLQKAEAIIRSKRYNFIVLDELLYVPAKQLAKEADIARLIRSKPESLELVLTGGSAGRSILQLADYVSTISATKHPFMKGSKARRGIEY